MTEPVRPKKIGLATWASRLFGKAPCERTLRRWVHDGKIIPRPQKVGRAYLVLETARYIDTNDPNYLEEVAAALNESAA